MFLIKSLIVCSVDSSKVSIRGFTWPTEVSPEPTNPSTFNIFKTFNPNLPYEREQDTIKCFYFSLLVNIGLMSKGKPICTNKN